MFTSINCTIFDIPITWDRKRFETSRNSCRQARKLVEASINAQYNKQLREVFYEKLDVEKTITESQQRLLHQERKERALETLLIVASQSLPDYFDKRMETARMAIQEHCDAIQKILHEENEHWQEIHASIDQNLITSEDIHRHDNIEEETPVANIHTINEEADEESEQTSKLVKNESVTPLLTQMIRKSRLLSNRRSSIQPNISSAEELIQAKREQFSVMVPLDSARRTLPVIDTTFVVKAEVSQVTEPNESNRVEIESSPTTTQVDTLPSCLQSQQSESYELRQDETVPIQTMPSTHVNIIPTYFQANPSESYELNQDEIAPVESSPATKVEMMPSFSQPKPPAQLYFSPTLLQEAEEHEPMQVVLSTVDPNHTNIEKPKPIPRRFGQTFLLDNMKTEELNQNENTENIRPTIPDELLSAIHLNPSVSIEKQSLEESVHQEAPIINKRPTRANRTKVEVALPTPPTRRVTRKRKQSASEDQNNNTVALRKKKTVAAPAKVNTRKTKAKKAKEEPIRAPSPLPIIDRSKHYSTRFSTRSHRVHNVTLSTTMTNTDKKSKSNRIRTRSMERTHESDGHKTRSTVNKTQPEQRAKSMVVTRSRRK